MCSPGHALAAQPQVSVHELAPHPLLLLDRTTSSRAVVELAFARKQLTPSVAMEMSSVEVLKRLAELGFGVAIVPRFSVHREQAAGTLSVLTLTDFGAPRSVGALTPRAFAPTHAARAFLELSRAHTLASRAGGD